MVLGKLDVARMNRIDYSLRGHIDKRNAPLQPAKVITACGDLGLALPGGRRPPGRE